MIREHQSRVKRTPRKIPPIQPIGDNRKLSEELARAASIIQANIDDPDTGALSSLRTIPALLRRVQKEYAEVEARLEVSNINEGRLAMQYNIAHILAETNSISKAAPQVMRLICEMAGWEYGAFWQVESDGQTLTNEGIWSTEHARLSTLADQLRYSILNADEPNLPGTALHSDEPLWNASLDDLDSEYARQINKAGLRVAYLLTVKSGKKKIAVLECYSSRPTEADRQLKTMLNAVSNQVGVFLERKMLENTLAQRLSQQKLLADVGLVLSTSVDLDASFRDIAHVIVPEMADWCAIDIIDQNNIIRRVAAAHVDASRNDELYKLQPTHQVDLNRPADSRFQTLLEGASMLMSDITPRAMTEASRDPEHLKTMVSLNPISSIIVPLSAHGKILGFFTFVQSDSGRHYSVPDLVLAEDIVRRMSLALDNTVLFAEAQKLNVELEQRVETRTAQLKAAVSELTNQIAERQNAEEQVRMLNSQLEQRIVERTSQLEVANHDLNTELVKRQKTSEALKAALKRTRELYRISQTIGMVRTPGEVLRLLISSTYLKDVSRASIAILDNPWVENAPTPVNCFILAEWNRGVRQPRFLSRHFSLEEYGVKLPIPYGQPLLIPDIQSEEQLDEHIRRRFHDLRTHSLIILPLIAGGEFYGLLSLHFKTRRMTSMDDLRHMRGLVDEAALVIKNMRLLETESQARQEAERANELKLKFLGMISHELRTPLTSIKGFVTTLLADDVKWPEDKQHEFLETINAESDKLHELIEQLLDLSRMEAGILRISPVKTSLEKVVESARPQLEALAAEHTLVMDIPSRLPPVYGDQQRLAQVITNLVSNAAKFSPPSTTIQLSARPLRQAIRVDVVDEGAGIAPADREKIFTAFQQLDSGSESIKKGAGLGLAICKGLIEAHHGKIWVQGHKGQGTMVSFTLPIMNQDSVAAGLPDTEAA